MKMKYITKIKAKVMIHMSKKVNNLLEGSYRSIFRGKSSNFEDLREYIIGDDIKDIDWKATARNSNTLVKQYRAEKKHNIMIILDTGKKMLADTEDLENKKEVALMTCRNNRIYCKSKWRLCGEHI